MPVKNSPYFNSPAIAAIASNLSGLFEPPSGADAAGWATAQEKRAQINNLGRLFDYSQDPNMDQARFDRMGAAAGQWTPSQGYYAVDQSNATSRANNAADNVRALRANQLDNQTKVIIGLNGPLDPGQVSPAVSADFMKLLDMPAMPERTGAPKPQTEDELKAAIFANLPPEQKKAIVFGNTPVENVATPDGPRIATRLDAIGQQPAPKDQPPGMSITLPDGTVVQQGGKPMTEAQSRLANYVATAKAMNEVLARDGNELTSTTQGLSEAAPTIGTVNPGNYVQSPTYQAARNAGERFVQSVLRNESGAATPDKEIAHYQSTLLPRPGDAPETLKLKAWLRQVAVNAMEAGMTVEARRAMIDAAAKSGPPPGFTAAAGGSAAAPDSAAQTGQADIARPETQQEFDALPSGAIYLDPEDGKRYRKP